MIFVAAGIIEDRNKILIARRKEGKHLSGYWEFPGGKIEVDESPEDCLKRELREEFSIETEIKNFVGESSYRYPHITIKLMAYTVKIKSGYFKMSDHDKVEWILLEDIKNFKMAPADIPIIKKYEQHRAKR